MDKSVQDKIAIFVKAANEARTRGDEQKAAQYLEAAGELGASTAEMERPNVVERVGRGVADVTQGVKQKYLEFFGDEAESDAYNQQISGDIERYNRGRGEAGFDWGRMAGNVGITAPAALVPGGQTIPARAAIGAATGGLLGASMVSENPDSVGSDTAMQGTFGTILGGALPVMTRGLAAGGARVIGAGKNAAARLTGRQALFAAVEDALAKANIPAGDPIRAALMSDAQRQLDLTGILDPEALLRKYNIKQFGIEPTTSQVTRDPSSWTRERNLSKIEDIGTPLQERFIQQNQQLNQKAGEIAGRFGPYRSGYEVGRDAIDASQSIAGKTQKVVSGAYDEALNTPGVGDTVADVAILKDGLTEVYGVFDDVIPSPIKSRLTALVDGDVAPTIANIDEAMKLVNRRTPSNAAEAKALGEIKDVLRSAIDTGGASSEALKTASNLAARRFALIDGRTNQKTSLITRLAENKVDADRFVKNNVANGKTDDVASLKRFLTQAGEEFPTITAEEGVAAWNGIRRSVVDNIMRTANLTDDVTTGQPFSGIKLQKALEKLGPEKRDLLFSKEENQLLDAFAKAATDLTNAPPFNAVNNSNTSSATISMLSKARLIPVIGTIAETLLNGLKDASKKATISQAMRGEVTNPVVQKAQYETLRNMIEQGRGYYPGLNHLVPARVGGVLGGTAPTTIQSILGQEN